MIEAALELWDISKRFGPVTALDRASLTARPGAIHALLGENGAGKTTLMRIAFGLIQPDSGVIAIGGNRTRFSSPSGAIAAGIGMVHQQFSLVPAMTVAENVALGGKGRFKPQEVAARISDVGRRTGLKLNPEVLVSTLGNADRQKLEIVRTLAHDARILILDEPTALLTPHDIAELFRQLRSFADSGGVVILITHKLNDALAHGDEVTVLRRGRVVLTAKMSDTNRRSLTAAMLGFTPEQPEAAFYAPSGASVIASLDEVSLEGIAGPVSLDVRSGEITGVAALDDGASGLLRALAGRMSPEAGVVRLPPEIAFVPENRQDDALIPEFDLVENFALRDAGKRKGLIDWGTIESRVNEVIRDFDIVAPGARVTGDTLSGGNQQRFVLGRELHGDPPLLVLENPTQGLDVKAAAAIHSRIRKAASNGTAVVLYSSDLDELAEISHRVLVVRGSGVAFSEPERESIGHLLLEA